MLRESVPALPCSPCPCLWLQRKMSFYLLTNMSCFSGGLRSRSISCSLLCISTRSSNLLLEPELLLFVSGLNVVPLKWALTWSKIHFNNWSAISSMDPAPVPQALAGWLPTMPCRTSKNQNCRRNGFFEFPYRTNFSFCIISLQSDFLFSNLSVTVWCMWPIFHTTVKAGASGSSRGLKVGQQELPGCWETVSQENRIPHAP